ncbi:MAG: hypothetical protein ISS16_06505 [Ignavibacteria bacterium]|nr:hypothetical protein [Ignavibacteria bacterium]
MKTLIVVLIKIIITNFALSQYNSKQQFNLSLTQGFSYNKKQTNFHYINLDAGFKIFKNHEVGICIGDNNMIWYGGYYRIFFEDDINLGLKIAKDDSFTDFPVYNEVTFGKDFKITDSFYFRTNFFVSVRSKYPLGIQNNKDNKFGLLVGINYLL